MAWRRTLLLALLVPLLVGATMADGGRPATHREVRCGGERWGVKTLSDRRRFWVDVDDVHPTTVRSLRRRIPPGATGDDTPRRRGVETAVFRVSARAVQMKREPDLDVHLVIRRLHRPGTMIVELPSRHCLSQRSRARRRMVRARRRLVAAFGRPTTH